MTLNVKRTYASEADWNRQPLTSCIENKTEENFHYVWSSVHLVDRIFPPWLHLSVTKAQDGGICIRDILNSFLYRKRKWRGSHSVLFMSVVQTQVFTSRITFCMWNYLIFKLDGPTNIAVLFTILKNMLNHKRVYIPSMCQSDKCHRHHNKGECMGQFLTYNLIQRTCSTARYL